MIRSRLQPLSLVLAGALAATASAGTPSRLAEGGLARREAPAPAPLLRRAATAPPALEARRFSERLLTGTPAERGALPKTLGDRLVVSLDDDALPDFVDSGLPVAGEYEARLSVSDGAAGPSDWLAVRFPARDLATGLPVLVREVVLGLDDLNGATTWPAVELWLEDPAAPLRPRSGVDSAVAPPLDAALAGLVPAPAGAFEPSRFLRVRAGLPGGLTLPADWLGDGAFDDAFDRFDQPLDDLAGQWLECEGDACCDGAGCAFARSMRIAGTEVVRNAGSAAPTLAIRFPDPAVEAQRPAVDLDVRVSASLDVSAATAGVAGLALRALATDAYYAVLIDPVPSPDELVAMAITPMGAVELGREPLVGDGGTRSLSVEALGVNPAVRLAVTVDGAPHGPFVDDVYRWAGTFVGLVAGTPGSSGERWDDFTLERRRDVFVTVQVPPGEDAGLALDVSESSAAFSSVLTSTDGAAWSPLSPAEPAFCFNPGNPFVQLEVEEIDAAGVLFANESRIVTLDLDCPTCPVTRNRCNANESVTERFPALPTVGEALSVSVGWWNEHVGADRLLLRASIWEGDCDAAAALLASATFVAGDRDGQAITGGAAFESATGVLDFTPSLEGAHCLVVEEFHDANADCCPDGWEATGPFDDPLGGGACPGACTAAPAADSNPSTGVLVRDFQVFRACAAPAVTSDMDGGSLRLSKAGGVDPVVTDLLLLDDTRTVYNVHAMAARPFDTMSCFEGVAPIFDRLVFSGPVGNEVRRSYALPAPADGRPLWLAAFETDGCPAALSLPDSSASDPALGTCLP